MNSILRFRNCNAPFAALAPPSALFSTPPRDGHYAIEQMLRKAHYTAGGLEDAAEVGDLEFQGDSGFAPVSKTPQSQRKKLCASIGSILLVLLVIISVSSSQPEPLLTTDTEYTDPRHLVIVAGHSVLHGLHLSRSYVEHGAAWDLEPFQQDLKFQEIIQQHLELGLEMLRKGGDVLLMLSGGQTHRATGPRSEAESYYLAAQSLGLLTTVPIHRIGLEEYARNSFENLLFSICRFKEMTGSYPEEVSIISLPTKENRFLKLHRAALKFPKEVFHFIGSPDPMPWSSDRIEELQRGEAKHAYKLWERDPYGCVEQHLVEKKKQLNPYKRAHGYVQSCPELKPILSNCLTSIYTGPLPWSSNQM